MSIKNLSMIAMMTAITAVLGAVPPIVVPITPIPITIQSIAPMLAGAILGAKRGALSMILFIILIACSVPLLSGGRGGIGVLFGPTGGFVFGWILVAFLIGLFVRYSKRLTAWKLILVNIAAGICVLYICGAGYLSLTTAFSFSEAMKLNLVFVPGDSLKAIVAGLVAVRVRQALYVNSSSTNKVNTL
ncbi:biotin transporter BioY [Shouchella patagoniensis]|uniref:biotin transporter BioY n=1 Tax=Shouchella patagoniensis TaxID=228576 RepID=UPI000994A5FF|nr:biotin transporter BioY [Shouchella patagoniensis]